MGEDATREEWGAPGVPSRPSGSARRPTTGGGSPLPHLPASRLLVGGRRLLLLPRLVDLVGLNEAIVLQQVRYYLEDERQPRIAGGRRWVRATLDRWHARDFPFWTTRTIERTFASLAAHRLVVARQLDIRAGDATNSYTIDWANLAALEHASVPPARPGDGSAPTGDETLPPLPASNHLDEEDLLPIGVQLAAMIGLDEAVVLRQIYYWLGDRRRPPVRDGRRWVCPTQIPFWESLAFRSRKTIQRALQELERRGLLLSSAAYNASPRDRTKWYTIDFIVLEALDAGSGAATTPSAVPNNPECRDTATRNVAMVPPDLSGSNRPPCRQATTQYGAMEATNLAAPLKDRETDPETQAENQQQYAATESAAAEVVVVAPMSAANICEDLVRLGVTRAVARRLLDTFGAARAGHHCEVHAWECAASPDRPELTPGRLRRRIEEDWADPPGFRTAAERAAQEAARASAAEREAGRARREVAVTAARRQAHQDRLTAVGLTSEDQALWSRLALEAPALPPLFRQALFYDANGATPAALLFPTSGDVERALGAAHHRATRAAITARVARHHSRPVEVHYLWYDEVARLLREDAGGATVVEPVAGPA